MSFGKMNTNITLIERQRGIDSEGFKTEEDIIVATIRAYREGRHASEKWVNRAAFTDATDLFRFRYIPDVALNCDMVIETEGCRFEITFIENVKGRNMYTEVLAKEVKASGRNQNNDA